MPGFEGLVGRSLTMVRLFEQIRTVAGRFQVASLEGEDGTGKSAVARVLHRLSPAVTQAFVPCLASLFFTPESPDVPWSLPTLERAVTGTLFLDRAHELNLDEQRRLFQFLLWLEHQYALGEARVPRYLIVGSDVPLRRLVIGDTFRADVCCRLGAVRLFLPALRDRREDIPLLAQLFIDRLSETYAKPVRGLGHGSLSPLLRHGWPGNVRELESVLSYAVLSTESRWIRPIDLPPLAAPPAIPQPSREAPGTATAEDPSLDAAMRRHIERVLEIAHGNKARAAAMLGISRSTLYRMLAAREPLPVAGG